MTRRADGSRHVGYIPGYQPSSLAVDCRAVLEAHPHLRPMGCRGVGYILMSWPFHAARIAADQARYLAGLIRTNGKGLHMDRVKEALIDARRGRYIPWEWVFDQRAVESVPLEYDDLDDWLRVARDLAEQFRLPRQRGQARFIEVWTEAAATVVVVERVAHDYGVPVYSDGGQNHITGIHDLEVRASHRDVPTLVLHLGDHDPKGRHIFSRFAEDVRAFNPDVEFERIGITEEQIDRLDLAGRADDDGHLQLEAMIEHLQPETEVAIRARIHLDVLSTVVDGEQAARTAALDRLASS